jgi:hypothetical protein
MSHEYAAGQNHCIRIGKKSFKNVVKLKYLGTTLTNQNCTRKEFKIRFNSRNSCYHLVQNLLSSNLLSKNVKIEVCRTLIWMLFLYGYKTDGGTRAKGVRE